MIKLDQLLAMDKRELMDEVTKVEAVVGAYTERCTKAEKTLAIMRDAVQFYANRNHWMGRTESSETETVLIAHGNADSFEASKDGWSMAEWALRQTAKI